MAPLPQEDKDLWYSHLAKTQQTSPQLQYQENGKLPVWDSQDKPINRLLNWYELSYNGSMLKFTMEIFGKQPESGYPLYIGLHGGGTDTSDFGRGNNKAWYHLATSQDLYLGSVQQRVKEKQSGAIYMAARGVDNEWNLHFMPNSYALYTKLIRQLIRPKPFSDVDWSRISAGSAPKSANSLYTLAENSLNFVDPNKICIVGFSAGGDGVYRLATSLADQFAAANMSAGHAGDDVQLQNLANLPFAIQVGDKDVEYFRSKNAVERFLVLKGWQTAFPGSYTTDCFLHNTVRDPKELYNNRGNGENYWPHNSWEYAETGKNFDVTSKVFREDVLRTWKDEVEKFPRDGKIDWTIYQDEARRKARESARLETVKFYDSSAVQQDKTRLQDKNTNAVRWMAERNPRNPAPSTVVWNLRSRPLGSKDDPHWLQQRFFYWLYIRDTSTPDFQEYDQNGPKLGPEGRSPPLILHADIRGNTINLHQPREFLGILLKEGMLDLAQDVTVAVPSTSNPSNWTNLNAVKVQPSKTIKEETLAKRGDLNYMFSAALWLQKDGASWKVQTGESWYIERLPQPRPANQHRARL